MVKNYRTKQEMIEYFRWLAYEFEKDAVRNNDKMAKSKSEAYLNAAFELEYNLGED